MTEPVDHKKAAQDAEWLAGSEADTAERNLARAYIALRTRAERAEQERDAERQRADLLDAASDNLAYKLTTAESALVEAQQDKERLDWFDRIWKDDDTTSLDKAWQSSTPGPAGSGRAGIDAARRDEKA